MLISVFTDGEVPETCESERRLFMPTEVGSGTLEVEYSSCCPVSISFDLRLRLKLPRVVLLPTPSVYPPSKKFVDGIVGLYIEGDSIS